VFGGGSGGLGSVGRYGRVPRGARRVLKKRDPEVDSLHAEKKKLKKKVGVIGPFSL